jgi:hypothetical protein
MADNSQNNQASNFKPYNFNIKHPSNIFLVFSFFSPFIVIFFFTFMGMYFSPLTGIIFLITIIITIFLRMRMYNFFTTLTDNETNSCNLINYSGIGSGDIYLSLWVFSFTLFYIIVPLISNNGIQTSLMTFLVLFLLLFVSDILIKFRNDCYDFNFKGKKTWNILFNIFIGGIFGLLISLSYSMIDSLKPHLFFSQKSSNETCKQVNDTKFQCSFDFE